MFQLSGVLSMRTGRAPTYRIALRVAEKVRLETRTRSPSPTPSRSMARWSAAVPLDRATPWDRLETDANSASNASTSGPSGAIQPPSKARLMAAWSAKPVSGGR